MTKPANFPARKLARQRAANARNQGLTGYMASDCDTEFPAMVIARAVKTKKRRA